MPVYVYRNLNTHETFEVEQRITEDAWTRHPESGDPVKRLVQPVGIAFKGSGFYVTDTRGGSKAAANGSAGGATDVATDGGAKESGASEKRDASASSGGKEAAKSDAGSGSGASAAKKSSAVD